MAETSASATGSKLKYEEDALLRALHGVKGSLVTSGVDSYRSRIGQSNIFLWRSRESGGNIYYEFREEESSKSAIKPLQKPSEDGPSTVAETKSLKGDSSDSKNEAGDSKESSGGTQERSRKVTGSGVAGSSSASVSVAKGNINRTDQMLKSPHKRGLPSIKARRTKLSGSVPHRRSERLLNNASKSDGKRS